ncbi:hypothetical protein GCM10023223_14150 [Stackebrandtia albiflava]
MTGPPGSRRPTNRSPRAGRTLRAAAIGVAVALTATTGPAWSAGTADSDDGAVCETRHVEVDEATADVRTAPEPTAQVLFTASRGERFRCGAVTMGGAHSLCGADGYEVWMVITDYERFDLYLPTSCLTDVWPE